MLKLTLDWNCVIEVEEARPQCSDVLDLVALHRGGELEVSLLAASASENTKSRRFPGNAGLFRDRITALGWDDLPLVPMPAVFGLSYFDFCYWVGDGDAFDHDMDALWRIIAPRVQRKPADHLGDGVNLDDETVQSEGLSKWRNTWCDVISAYSHIHEGRDVFVTNNTKDFQRNADALAELGMKQICRPMDASNLISKLF